ncbi:MAG: prepilin-type N-terminal cleavage/methylation domain-containing protein [Pseudomonadota bacterium]
MIATSNDTPGFTLVELLIAMAIAGIVMAGVYSAYSSQQRSYIVQEQVAAVQQNLRVAMYFMEREIRMAGCDPKGSAGAGIRTASPNSIRITMDITGGQTDGLDNDGDSNIDEADEANFGDGDTNDVNEDLTYSLYTSGGIQKLGRKKPSTNNQPVAENIDALNLVYLDKDEKPTITLAEIRSVQITLVARTARADRGFKNTTAYTNQQGDQIFIAPGDNFRRKLLTAQVNCRNLAF